MHTLHLGLRCRCVCPFLTYGKSSKLHNKMAILLDIPDFLYACTLVDKGVNRQSAGIREYPRKFFCILELSSMFWKEKNRKEKWKET